MEGYIGQIMLYASNRIPVNWRICQGQLVQISDYPALYSVLGLTYGGNGSTNFQLPDLRARIPVGMGQGTGLTNMQQGAYYDQYSMTLTESNMPYHNHSMPVSSVVADQVSPEGCVLGTLPSSYSFYSNIPTGAQTFSTTLPSETVSTTGSNQKFYLIGPCVGLNYLICVAGAYPTRS